MTSKIKLTLAILAEVANLNRIEQKRLNTYRLENIPKQIKYSHKTNCYVFDGVLSLGQPNDYTPDHIEAVAYYILRSGYYSAE